MSLEIIKRFQDYGMKLVPLNDDTKKPKTKLGADGAYHWKGVPWSEN